MNFFFCPASDYLNQFNEAGSHGQISYQFIKHLSLKPSVKKIKAIVMLSLKVQEIPKTTIEVVINKKRKNADKTEFDSLYFYIISFIRYFSSKAYKESDIVHHIIPFMFGSSFNLFFIFKNKNKQYVIGPIIGPHIDTGLMKDEAYVFNEDKSKSIVIKRVMVDNFKKTLLWVFGSILYRLSLLTLRNADYVFFSDQHALNYHKKFLKNSQKSYILDTGIDTNVFKPDKNNRKNSDFLTVLFVGRLTKRKGCEFLIRAIAEAKKINKGIKLKCKIHGIGPLMDELRDLARKLAVESQIEFLGGVNSNEEIVKRYYDCDVVCLPALSETFTVTKEALSCGKPVIVTDVCSNAERIQEGINGFIVKPRDSRSIAKVLVRLASNKKELKILSENAAQSRTLYDWDNIISKYLAYIS
jgi:glycosyltransferase involved in cell wall biosynthesis